MLGLLVLLLVLTYMRLSSGPCCFLAGLLLLWQSCSSRRCITVPTVFFGWSWPCCTLLHTHPMLSCILLLQHGLRLLLLLQV